MAFGDVIRSAPSPSSIPSGIGGDSNTIWHCDQNNTVYELSTADFSVIRSASSPSTNPSGIGGDSNTIWHCNGGSFGVTGTNYELSTTDFSLVRSATAPDDGAIGIGGDSNTIWYCDSVPDFVYELSTVDFSIIRSSPLVSMIGPGGVGGDINKIWQCDNGLDLIREISTSDLSVIQSTSPPSTIPSGIGGDSNTIWHCDEGSDKIYELGTGVNYTISGNVKDYKGNNVKNASITFVNSESYETTTDTDGNYLQSVNPDTYNVSAYKHGYPKETAFVDASSSDQIQNFILRCTPREIIPSSGIGKRPLVGRSPLTKTRPPTPPAGRLKDTLC